MKEKTVLPLATLVFYTPPGHKVSLAIKADKIGAGCRNGAGGGMEAYDRSIRHCAVRELRQEFGVRADPGDLTPMAICTFINEKSGDGMFICYVVVYVLKVWRGEPRETRSKEMLDPKWFSKTGLPLDDMMLADRDWVPKVMDGKRLLVEAQYGPFQKKLLAPVRWVEVDVETLDMEIARFEPYRSILSVLFGRIRSWFRKK